MTRVCGYKHLLIDDQSVLKVRGLTRRVNPAVKHPQPVLTLDAPWDRDNDFFNYLNVLYDDRDELFRMWYSTMSYHGQNEDGPRRLHYATSKDGIHWDKPILNLVELHGSRENNCILPQMGLFCGNVILDPSDIDERRFKMTFSAEASWEPGISVTNWSNYFVPVCLAYSHDGIQWQRPPHVNPILRGLSDGGWSFHYDRDRRVYVLLTRRVPNLPRDISQYESHDLVNWRDLGRVLVPGDEYDPPDMFNFQSMAAFPYEDMQLAVLNTQYSLPHAESYESFHRPPDDLPAHRFGRNDIQLAYSRDGRTWCRPRERTPIVAVGSGEHDRDRGMIFLGYNPIVRDGETYIYYTGVTWRHSYWDMREQYARDNGVTRHQSAGMLAKMPEDHFVSLDAGDEEGCLLTHPHGPPHELFVNADAQGGYVKAELVTPYGQVMPGYSRDQSTSITGSGPDQQLRWKNGGHPWDEVDKHLGGVHIRFLLRNAKLYSYTFTLPDPDGELERQKRNARWCDHIKNRGNLWGQNNNEPPAVGLPGYQPSVDAGPWLPEPR